jgi:hypothetical protein
MDKSELKKRINEMVTENNDWTMFADGFDEAILGVDSCNSRVIYSVEKCYQVLRERDGMSQDDAEEFFAFNVLGSFMGEKTPIWCFDLISSDEKVVCRNCGNSWLKQQKDVGMNVFACESCETTKTVLAEDIKNENLTIKKL